jgi:REP-associated tyrosine transposase
MHYVLNRAVARLPLFQNDADYEAFERVLAESLERHPTRIAAYCLMPNHWPSEP